MNPRELCPCPRKRAFGTLDDAEQSMQTIWRRARGGTLPSRAYLCACGAWHLTSRPDLRKVGNG